MNLSNIFSNKKKAFNQAPFELRLYAFFAFIVSFLGIILPILDRKLYEKLLPFTGWSPAGGYMFSLCLLIPLIFGIGKVYPSRVKYGIAFMISLSIFSGIRRQIDFEEMQYDTNPYLRISEYQYIWTILIPVLWILVILFSPNISQFFNNLQKRNV